MDPVRSSIWSSAAKTPQWTLSDLVLGAVQLRPLNGPCFTWFVSSSLLNSLPYIMLCVSNWRSDDCLCLSLSCTLVTTRTGTTHKHIIYVKILMSNNPILVLVA